MKLEEEERTIELERQGIENTLEKNEEVTDVFRELIISVCDENEEALKQLGDEWGVWSFGKINPGSQ